MRSREQNPEEPSLEENNKTVSPDVHDPAKSEKPPKSSRKLFAFLSCCSSSDVDPEDGSIPPKKTTRRPSVPQTQPTPEKADVNAADSSTAESKAPSFFKDEKPNTGVASDKPNPQLDEERIVSVGEQSSQFDGTKTATTIPESTQDTSPSKVYSGTSTSDAQPSVPTDAVQTEPTVSEKSGDNTKAEDNAAEGQGTEESTISAPVTTNEEDTKQIPRDEEAVSLPPPPPLGKQPEVSAQEKAQQWLLPPVLPHLQGRKCLVLDLDETLVHSSFKVTLPATLSFKGP